MAGKLRVVVADDHTLMRSGFSALLTSLPGVDVVGEASNGREALRLVKDLAPDILLMDISMPELSGLLAAEQLKQRSANTKVLILSMHASKEYVIEALRAGASGYLLKDATLYEVETALKVVGDGSLYLSPSIAQHVVGGYLDGGSDSELLSLRQREILQLFSEGKSVADIADILHLSKKTIEGHRAELMRRLGIQDVVGLVRYAWRKGMITA
jgi:DNA-binding NarL/FixJ family response regulator